MPTFVNHISLCLGFLILISCSEVIHALEMISDEDDTGRKILLLQDCKDSKTRACRKHEKDIHIGDAERLRGILAVNSFAEIWLASGGGNLMEGIEIGKVLRKNKLFVRVPSGARCVSSCTVAFLGGVLRTVDRGATYEVHAYTSEVIDTHGMERDPELTLEKMLVNMRKSGGIGQPSSWFTTKKC